MNMHDKFRGACAGDPQDHPIRVGPGIVTQIYEKLLRNENIIGASRSGTMGFRVLASSSTYMYLCAVPNRTRHTLLPLLNNLFFLTQ